MGAVDIAAAVGQSTVKLENSTVSKRYQVSEGVLNHSFKTVSNPGVLGSLLNIAATDGGLSEGARSSNNLVLVGGPAVNDLVEELALFNRTWSLDDWREREGYFSGSYGGEWFFQW